MKNRRHHVPAVWAVSLATAGSLLLTGSPAHAASAGTWNHGNPSVTTLWHCGKTINAKVFSGQSCVIVNGSYWQSAVIVRNRSTKAVSTTAWTTEKEEHTKYETRFNCSSAKIKAGTYSVCFGATRKFNPKASNLRLVAEGAFMDSQDDVYLGETVYS